ncbi:MAG TPA: hypothetical protein VG944_23485 [Fimbriimonas sp.]|nr:hypothetical protein [Fimbriimonas sp.]
MECKVLFAKSDGNGARQIFSAKMDGAAVTQLTYESTGQATPGLARRDRKLGELAKAKGGL